MLEELPNEIILSIFSYLELTELHRAFSFLNYRFECLLLNNFTPLYARLTSNITLPLDNYYFRITNLSLIDWLPNEILLLFKNLNFLRLKKLNIESTNNLYFGQPTNDLIHQILSLESLFKCRINLSPTLYILNDKLSISKTIEYLNLSMITLDMLFNLLIHVPKLRSLNVWLNSNGRRFDSKSYDKFYCCLNLKKFSIGLHNDIKFEEILFLLLRMPVLHSFKIYGSVWDHEYLNENHWKNIISGENFFPLLNKININISVRYTSNIQNIDFIPLQFNEEIYHRTNFSVTFDRIFWFYIKCLWNG